MSRVDYSQWNQIEISDDEDDTHPNVDTEYLFRLRHERRIHNMKKEEKQATKRKEIINGTKSALDEVTSKIKEEDGNVDPELLARKEELEKQHAEFLQLEAEFQEKQKKYPKWHIDNICKEGFSSSKINKYKEEDEKMAETLGKLSEEQKEARLNEMAEEFCKLRSFDDMENHIRMNPAILNQEGISERILVIATKCLFENDVKCAQAVIRSSSVLYFCTELKKGNALSLFFSRMKQQVPEAVKAFQDECEVMFELVSEKARALQKEYEDAVASGEIEPLEDDATDPTEQVDGSEDPSLHPSKTGSGVEENSSGEAVTDANADAVEKDDGKENEQETMLKRLGTFAVDKAYSVLGKLGYGPKRALTSDEVFDEMPDELQTAVIERDVDLLREALANLSPEDARYHMSRAKEAGLIQLQSPPGEEHAQEAASGEQ
eukprot:Nk52_evm56s226 gene=Nk52_evmTU56s226